MGNNSSLDFKSSSSNVNATRGVDNLNNIEQITFDNPAAGTYKIIVTGTTVPLNTEFSVVYDYVAPELLLTYPMGGEKFNPGTTEYIRWDYEGEDKTFNIEFSNDGGLTYTVIAANVPSARNFCGQFLLIGFQMQKLELVQEVKLTFLHNPFRLCRNQKI
jgi:hypothetical protein